MISDLAQRLIKEINSHLPEGSAALPKQELNNLLQAALGKLDLVTREEFDAQTAVLQRTREKLEALEAQLDQLLSTPPQP
jgi:BMFP domain-containing protein YqiC